MKKWRNLRDTFKRHLKQQKNNREESKQKRKEYVYFKHMSFLLPHIDSGGGGRSPPAPRRPRRRPDPSVLALSPSPSSYAIEHIDADKHFLLSLLPSFKSMSENEKLTAKMEILKVIKDVKSAPAALGPAMPVRDPSGRVGLAAPTVTLSDDETIQVKSELFTVEELDYESLIDSGGGDTEWPLLKDTSEMEIVLDWTRF